MSEALYPLAAGSTSLNQQKKVTAEATPVRPGSSIA